MSRVQLAFDTGSGLPLSHLILEALARWPGRCASVALHPDTWQSFSMAVGTWPHVLYDIGADTTDILYGFKGRTVRFTADEAMPLHALEFR